MRLFLLLCFLIQSELLAAWVLQTFPIEADCFPATVSDCSAEEPRALSDNLLARLAQPVARPVHGRVIVQDVGYEFPELQSVLNQSYLQIQNGAAGDLIQLCLRLGTVLIRF